MTPASLNSASVLLTVSPTMRLEMVMVMTNRNATNMIWVVPLLPVSWNLETVDFLRWMKAVLPSILGYLDLIPSEVVFKFQLSYHHRQNLKCDMM